MNIVLNGVRKLSSDELVSFPRLLDGRLSQQKLRMTARFLKFENFNMRVLTYMADL